MPMFLESRVEPYKYYVISDDQEIKKKIAFLHFNLNVRMLLTNFRHALYISVKGCRNAARIALDWDSFGFLVC
jgi:hypothetical protein